MDNVNLEDTLHRKLEEEIKNRNDLISELKKMLISVENKKAPKVLNEIETLSTKLDSYVKQSRKMFSFVPHAKMNGKVGFYAWFPLWFINIQSVVILLWMGIPYMVKFKGAI